MNHDRDKPVIGIDLGATYTKVAYLPKWESGRRFCESAKIVMIEKKPLVPSLVIKQGGGLGRWLHGKSAAAYRPTSEDIVFSNWKADLFSHSLTPRVSRSLKAAGEFFRWLHGRLVIAGISVSQCRVKVCLPCLPDIERTASILGQEMELAGWKNKTVTRVAEPSANTIGVFSEGRNVLYDSPIFGEVNPVFLDIFSQNGPLLAHMRRYALKNGRRRATVAIVDIGSFTTDFSIVEVDSAAGGNCIEPELQSSVKLGLIDGYERPFLRAMEKRHGFDSNELSFEDKEHIKRTAGSQRVFVLTLPNDTNVQIGDAEDQKRAQSIVSKFATRIREHYRDFVGHKRVDYLTLTGGGSASPLVADMIKSAFRHDEAEWVDAEGLELPTRNPPIQMRAWPDTGEPLSRLATALGAVSVVSDLPSSPPLPDLPKMQPVVSPYVACSCLGGNKDCMRCAGAGQYLRKAS